MRYNFLFTLIITLLIGLSTPALAQQKEDSKTTATTTTKEKNQPAKASKQDDSVASTSTQKTIKRAPIQAPISLEALYKSDISHYLTNEQIKPLLIGSDDIITLVNEQTTANAKGVAILVPNWQQVATAPQAINFLRNSLPRQGWTTITIQSPEKPSNYPSTKLNVLERAEENKQSLAQYKQRLQAIITKVMAQAANYPGIFLMIAEGSNAALLIELYQEKKLGHPASLVMLSGHLLTEADNQQFAKQLAVLEIPVLDLYLARDSRQAIYSAPLRLAESKRQLKVYYQQKQLDNIYSGYYPPEILLKTINGWLKKIGW